MHLGGLLSRALFLGILLLRFRRCQSLRLWTTFIHIIVFLTLDDVRPFKESNRLSLLDDVHPFKESYRLSSLDDVHPFKESYRLSLFRAIVCIFGKNCSTWLAE